MNKSNNIDNYNGVAHSHLSSTDLHVVGWRRISGGIPSSRGFPTDLHVVGSLLCNSLKLL